MGANQKKIMHIVKTQSACLCSIALGSKFIKGQNLREQELSLIGLELV